MRALRKSDSDQPYHAAVEAGAAEIGVVEKGVRVRGLFDHLSIVIEHRPSKPRVAGSIPARRANIPPLV